MRFRAGRFPDRRFCTKWFRDWQCRGSQKIWWFTCSIGRFEKIIFDLHVVLHFFHPVQEVLQKIYGLAEGLV